MTHISCLSALVVLLLGGAREAMERRDYGEAEAELVARLADEPADAQALKMLADVYLRTEEPEKALAVAERARAAAPEDPYAIAAVWEARIAVGGWTDPARAAVKADVDAFLKSAPAGAKWPLVAAFLGYQLAGADDAKAALRERIATEMADDPPEELEGDLLEAVVVAREAAERERLIGEFLRLFPDSTQANYLREILLWVLRDDRARLLAAADGFLAADPDNRRVRAALARWLLTTEPADPARAERELVRALALLDVPREQDRPMLVKNDELVRMLRETRGRYLGWLGRARMLLGKEDAALAAFRDSATYVAADADRDLWRGDLLASRGDGDGAADAWIAAAQAGSAAAEARLEDMFPGDARTAARVRGATGPGFTDVTTAAGLEGVRGGRVALADATGDGFPDLLVGGSRLFVNRGDGTFERSDGLPALPGARGGLFADLDGDGDLDLFVFRTGHPMVLENDGAGRFTDRTPETMVDEVRHLTEGAAVLDVDGDGRLDLYEADYERPPTPPYARGTPDRLWRNLGGFEFEDATDRISGLSAEPMCGRGAATADFDEDGDTDLFVANYRLDPDFLLLNRGGKLANEARARGVEGECDQGAFGHGIGPVFGDLDGDGHLDLVVGNLAHPRYIGFSDPTRVFLSSGPPAFTFRDVFRASGIRYEETTSNASLADVDLDGDLDLYLTSIYVGRKAHLWLNDGRARFTEATWLAGVGKDNGWGSAFADVDLDGDVDLVVGSGSGVTLYRNDGPTGGFVGLTLVSRDGNGSAIGARVTLEAPDGTRQVREVGGGTGTGCQDDPSIRFGVASAPGPFVLFVRWPCGREQRIFGVAPGAVYRLVEGGSLERIR